MKKILLTLGSAATVVAPLATVVACSNFDVRPDFMANDSGNFTWVTNVDITKGNLGDFTEEQQKQAADILIEQSKIAFSDSEALNLAEIKVVSSFVGKDEVIGDFTGKYAGGFSDEVTIDIDALGVILLDITSGNDVSDKTKLLKEQLKKEFEALTFTYNKDAQKNSQSYSLINMISGFSSDIKGKDIVGSSALAKAATTDEDKALLKQFNTVKGTKFDFVAIKDGKAYIKEVETGFLSEGDL